MSNLELRIEEEANLGLTISESSDMSFDAVDFVGVPFAPTVEVEDIEGGHRISITSMSAEGKKTDEFDVMDGADGATGPQGSKGDSYEITAADYAAIAEVVEEDIQDVIEDAQDAASDANDAAALATRAAASTWNAGNVLKGTLAEGTVLTTDDAWAAPPESVEVYGVSTQDGTPTPDVPVEIKSVDDLTLHVCGKNLLDSSHLLEASGWTESNGVYTGWGGSLHVPFSNGYPLPPFVANTRYTISFDFDYDGDAGVALVVDFVYADGRQANYVNAKNSHQSLTSSAGRTLTAIGFSYGTNRVIRLSNIQVEQASAATTYEPYVGQSVQIPLSNNKLRSLPDGTRDTLTLSYVAPSTEHEGWGVFGAELVQKSGVKVATEFDRFERVTLAGGSDKCAEFSVQIDHAAENVLGYCSHAKWMISNTGTYNYGHFAEAWRFYNDAYADVIAIGIDPSLNSLALGNEWLAENGPITFVYKLATPVTYDLGTVELPVLPNPLTAWADGGSAQPTMSMSYEQDINIVIGELRSAIADMATS